MHGIDTCPRLPPPLLRTKVQSIRACVNQPGTSLKANTKPSETQQKHAISQRISSSKLHFCMLVFRVVIPSWSFMRPSYAFFQLEYTISLHSWKIVPFSYLIGEMAHGKKYGQIQWSVSEYIILIHYHWVITSDVFHLLFFVVKTMPLASAMTGNGWNPTYKHGESLGMVIYGIVLPTLTIFSLLNFIRLY